MADPHSEPNSDCPRNLLGIHDYEQLNQLERVYVHKRLVELSAKPLKGRFDVAHLKATHRYLFQDVFPWAGEFRAVNISKGRSMFGAAQFIAPALEDLLAKLATENLLRGEPVDRFAERAGFYLGEINAIHPFREGNGRTQREFLRQLAKQAGHTMSWGGFTQQEMIDASVTSHLTGENGQLVEILRRALRKRGTE